MKISLPDIWALPNLLAVPVVCKQCKKKKCVFLFSAVNFRVGQAPLLPLYPVYSARALQSRQASTESLK